MPLGRPEVLKHVQAAGIAAASNIEMSSHLMPELSVHLLAATLQRTGSNMSTRLTQFSKSR